MAIPADRPRPAKHVYKGINLLIDIRWGEDDQPRLAVITAEDAPGVSAMIETSVNNYEDALALGIDEAEAWIDRR